MESKSLIYEPGYCKQCHTLDKSDLYYFNDHQRIILQICRSISVSIHGSFQFFQPSLFFPHQMKPFQKLHALHQDRFCQKRMKYQNGHKSDTEDIQHQPQIKHRQDSFQIFVKKSSSENRDPNTDHHKHQLIGNRHDHQDHR